MRLENVVVVAKREYLQRIKSKGFWIGTLILPLFVLAATVVPSVLMSKSRTSQTIVVVDETGRVAGEIGRERPGKEAADAVRRDADRIARFDIQNEKAAADTEVQRQALNRRVLDKEIDAWVWIGNDVFAGKPVEYHSRTVSNVFTQEVLEDDISDAVRRVRLTAAGFDPDRVGELSEAVDLQAVKVSETGSRREGGIAGAAFSYILFLLLYMVLAVWGQQVMNGVLEEKSSRVVEVVISSLRPFELMMGKLSGICLVGLTQFTIWLGTLLVVTIPQVLGTLATLPEGVTLPTVTVAMVVNFAILFVLGFFLFSTFYAAIGAAFNNVQEAQQVASVAVFFLVIPAFLMMPIINDPNSTMAVVTSLIPLFTPLLMTLRISLEMPPLWQILLSYVLTIAFLWGMIWVCARIYRMGILMYGKKPTFKELWKWVRYA
ncbi:MAG TPA: ABC transporter permease [Thermoanaerobaculia bacterium]